MTATSGVVKTSRTSRPLQAGEQPSLLALESSIQLTSHELVNLLVPTGTLSSPNKHSSIPVSMGCLLCVQALGPEAAGQ